MIESRFIFSDAGRFSRRLVARPSLSELIFDTASGLLDSKGCKWHPADLTVISPGQSITIIPGTKLKSCTFAHYGHVRARIAM